MAYQSQLVVRTRDEQRAEIIEQVKTRANEEGKTYSEMALELLERGLGAAAPRPPAAAKPAPEPDEPQEPEQLEEPVIEQTAADGGSRSRTLDRAAEDSDDPKKADEPAEPIPDVELPEDDSVEAVAAACAEYLEESGRRAATQLLAQFFATAGPVEGGKVKDQLQSQLDGEDYEAILEGLRETEQYRNYRQRVIFGS